MLLHSNTTDPPVHQSKSFLRQYPMEVLYTRCLPSSPAVRQEYCSLLSTVQVLLPHCHFCLLPSMWYRLDLPCFLESPHLRYYGRKRFRSVPRRIQNCSDQMWSMLLQSSDLRFHTWSHKYRKLLCYWHQEHIPYTFPHQNPSWISLILSSYLW